MTRYNKLKTAGIVWLCGIYLGVGIGVGNKFAFDYSSIVTSTLGQTSTKIEQDPCADEDDAEYYTQDYASLDDLIKDENKWARNVQAEGAVLLKNPNKMLPLTSGSNITLLGYDSKDSVFKPGGNGSGAANADRAIPIATEFTNAGYHVNQAMVDFYAGVKAEPAKEDYDVSKFEGYKDVGIVFIGRAGGESIDLTDEQMDLYQSEKDLVDLALANFDKVVVLLNVANPIELNYLQDKNVSILWIGGPGELGIGAIPEVLNGTRYPSGKNVDTYASDHLSAPAMQSHGDLNFTNLDATTVGNKYVNYLEGIYVGYRYYETRYYDRVTGKSNVGDFNYSDQIIYPFGYGLSYTEFSYSDFSIIERDEEVVLSVTVKNTGTATGKEAVQFYMSSPYTDYDKQNKVEKSAVQLVGFGKTKELKAGESDTVTYTVDKEQMKAYDYTTAKTYIVDDGDYVFTAAKDVHAATNNVLAYQGYTTANGMTENGDKALAGTITQKVFDKTTYAKSITGQTITNQFDKASMSYYESGVTYLTRNDWVGTWPKKSEDREATQKMIDDLEPCQPDDPNAKMPTMNANNGLTVASVMGQDWDSEYWDLLLDNMSAEEMMRLFAVGGYQTEAITSINKPHCSDQDGPAIVGGVMMGGATSFSYPCEVVFGSTYNEDLVRQMGYFASQDGVLQGVSGWYAPGVDAHRTPMSGRNFEYYSEDPLMTGLLAKDVVDEAQAGGLLTYTKHFALNDQETNRATACTFANEQAIREFYLKPFQYALSINEDGSDNGLGVMTSMNRVGMTWASDDYELMTSVLRDEWGFRGISITDATLAQSAKMTPKPALLAGTDLFLCTNSGIFYIDNYDKDATVMQALRQAARRIVYATSKCNAMNGITSSTRVVTVTPAWEYVLIAVDCVLGVGILAALFFSGRMAAKAFKEDKAQN